MSEQDGQKRVLKKLDLSLVKATQEPEPPDHMIPAGLDDAKTVINPADAGSDGDADTPDLNEIPVMVADRYRVIRQIGKGGMGVVLLAQDERLGRFVAIKRLIFKSSNMKLVQRRFLREAQTIAALGHANIVNVFDIGQDGEVGYITMEYVPGPLLDPEAVPETPPVPVTLDEYVKTKGPMEEEKAVELMLKICNAMAYAHKQGTIHRDIKPTNILLTDTMDPKVVDFGLARPIDISQTEEITLEGTMLGTPEYSAPEQWGDMKEVGTPSDVYAMGGVMWFVLTGRIPRFFREKELSPALGEIVGKALSQRPGDRYQQTEEMANDLKAVRDGAASETSPEIAGAGVADTQKMAVGGWQCSNCESVNPESAQFCVSCGASGTQSCILCGANMRVGAQFCPSCGEDVKLAEETSAILNEAKNHASFMEYEAALARVKDLAKKNTEAQELFEVWEKKVNTRHKSISRLEKAIQEYDTDAAVESADAIKDDIPTECLSETEDFTMVVRFSELLTELRRLLIETATKAHEEYDLKKFSDSIQALNRIFGEEVCGAVNSQLAAILGDIDRAMTTAGLALGMNCISKALEVISEIPPWKHGELGDRRMRLYQNCLKLKEERDKIIIDIEAAVFNERYSEALNLITKMGRFRLPPDHSEVDPSQADLDANERIVKVDKVLLNAIEENVHSWIKSDNWENITKAIVALEQGGSRNWSDLLQRLRFSIKSEITNRHESALENENKKRFSQAEAEWNSLLLVPDDFIPPSILAECHDFTNRRTLEQLRKARYKVVNGSFWLWFLFIAFSSWMIWYPLYQPQAFWDYLGDEFLGQIGLRGLNLQPGQHTSYQDSMTPALLQLFLFVVAAVIAKSKLLSSSPESLDKYSSMPRLLGFGVVAALSPLSMVVYEGYYHWVYIPKDLLFIFHPYLLVLLVWVGLDFFKGFKKERIPANFALTLSWVLTSFIMFADRHGPDVVYRTIAFPDEAKLFNLTIWPIMAIVHAVIYLIIIAVEHVVYLKKRQREDEEPQIYEDEYVDMPEDDEPIEE